MEFVDIHCHLLPGIDDGAANDGVAVSMAKMAVNDGIQCTIVTPHQLDRYRTNDASSIRAATLALQEELRRNEVPLKLLPGGDVRIEADLIDQIQRDHVLTLGDMGKCILLELPHEIYIPIEPVLKQLNQLGIQGILSHPERNRGIMKDPELVQTLVNAGCLMQLTADSIVGNFGSSCQKLSKRLLKQGLVHCVATDAHDCKRRRPVLSPAFECTQKWIGSQSTDLLFFRNPRAIANGDSVQDGPIAVQRVSASLFSWAKAGS